MAQGAHHGEDAKWRQAEAREADKTRAGRGRVHRRCRHKLRNSNLAQRDYRRLATAREMSRSNCKQAHIFNQINDLGNVYFIALARWSP